MKINKFILYSHLICISLTRFFHILPSSKGLIPCRNPNPFSILTYVIQDLHWLPQQSPDIMKTGCRQAEWGDKQAH